ncbi:NADP-dependent oxidoreductase [Nodosilinea sp. LEGE 07088]|uniref:NADP-dependent oxidoreductase n=1 Tax=Nodosilinea sp. LEGE 07088 TaxID=2777968 RepID=UPI0018815EBE|nr:NADP-dependent oxidoreductase [Nodosilinea sp. LEGE 07088]MBE9139787.1 NADP-dependent oxidoreductase [Nodosilinea sp. LEGE 07088]
MKAIQIHQYGGSETLTYEDIPRPEPAPEQVLVRIHAAGINPIDWKIRQGWLKEVFPYPFPLVLGTDMSGVVEKVGAEVTTLQPGQAVYGLVDMTLSGAYAEYGLGYATTIAPKPQTLSHLEAAAVPVVAQTAWQALFEVGNLQASQSVLIHAAAGGVGSFAVQFAKAKGLTVIGTASAQNLEFVRSLGADTVIDYHTSDLSAARGVDMVLDPIGGDTQARSWELLKPGGILVSTAAPPDPTLAEKHQVRGTMIMVQPRSQLLSDIAALIDAGKVKPKVSQVFPLAAARQAQELSQQGHTRGKIVLQVV